MPTASEQSYLPEKFKFFIVAQYFGDWHELEWVGKELWYRMGSGPPVAPKLEVKCLIAPAAWQHFWEGLDALNVSAWQEEYMNPDVMDGTSWNLEIVYQGGVIKSGGSNAYPGTDGPGYPSRSDFGKFVRLTKDLTGMLNFG